ncbi:MAG: alpha/beta hydrolase [Gammaproteobacteria bacterium]
MNRRHALTLGAAVGASLSAAHASAASVATPAGTPIPPRASFIERTDGTALFYKDWGAGKPVVFVHSAGINSDAWAYQMVPFVDHGMRCVAFDRRGHGRSSDPGRGYDFDTLADDLAAVMEVLDLRNATLIGHSMGCGEIVRYLTRYGSRRVARIGLLAPTLPFLLKAADNPHGVDKAVIAKIREAWTHDYPKWLSDNSPPFFTPDTSPEMMAWGLSLAFKTSLQAAIQCNVAVTETDFRSELPRVDVPTLILHGTKDVSCPISITGEPTARLIPGCQLKVYEGAPHGLFLTHIERVNADLLNFMRG